MLKLWRRASIIINALVFVTASAQGLLATTYNVVVLPVPGTQSEIIPLGMNDSGQVVGFVANGNNEQAFITDSQSYTFIPLPSGFTLYNPQFTLHSFNNSGQFVATLWAPTEQVPPIPFIGTINGFTPVPLQPVFPPTGWNVFGGSGGVGAINDSGQIVGSGFWEDVNSQCAPVLPYIGTAAGINPIPVPPNWQPSPPSCVQFEFNLTDINTGGQFVGGESIAGQVGTTPIFGTVASGIAPIPAPTGYLFSSSGDGGFGFTGPFINDSGQIAATFTSDPLDHNPQPFLGNANGFAPIPLPSGCSDGNIQGINDAGEVVGGCFNIIAPYVGTQSGTFLLNSLVPAGWFIESANAINNKGQIAAEAFDSNGIFHAVILTPDIAPINTLTKVSGDQQTGNVNSVLPNPLTVQITDQNGVPQSNVPITFSTSPAQWPTNAQNASLSTTQSLLTNTALTLADGTASTPFVVGNIPGQYQVTATCNGCTTGVVFSESAVACAVGSQILNVGLPAVTVNLPFAVKPWQVMYGGLGVNFAVTQATSSGDCVAQSNIGSLNVFARPFVTGLEPWLLFAYSTATVTVRTFMPSEASPSSSDYILDGPFDSSAHYIQWHTDGFSTQLQFPLNVLQVPLSTGPITAWLNLDREGLSPDDNTFEQIVRGAEPIIHQQLISILPLVAWYTIIQDPGMVTMVVTNQQGEATGIQPDGTSVNSIPLSFYYPSDSNPAVVMPMANSGSFRIVLTGTGTGTFALAISTENMTNDAVSESVTTGTISAGSSLAFDGTITANAQGVGNVNLQVNPIASLSLEINFLSASPGLNGGNKNSLLVKLQNAQEHLGAGGNQNVTNELGAFINEVEALPPQNLPTDIAAKLVAWTTDIISQLSAH